MSRPPLVALSGIDGTGKSTLSTAVASLLRKQGFRVHQTWLRRPRVLTLPFLALMYLVGLAHHDRTSEGGRVGVYNFYRNRVIARVWLHLTAIDYLLVSWFRARAWRVFGWAVVADRYALDAMVDLKADTGITGDSWAYRTLTRLANDDTICIVLEVPVDVSLQRKPDSVSKERLEARRDLYERIADANRLPLINASAPLEEVAITVLRVVESRLRGDDFDHERDAPSELAVDRRV